MKAFSEPVVFVDIETSGGQINNSRVTEVAAIRVEGGQISHEFVSLINPGMKLPYWITSLTGITDSDLVDAPSFPEIAPELFNVLDGAIFIAHNVRFDYGFIRKELSGCGFEFNPKLLCTVRLSRSLYQEAKGHSLEKIIARHNITVGNRHRAYDDAKAIMDFVSLAHAEKGKELFDLAVKNQLKTRTYPANVNERQIGSLKNAPGVYIFEDQGGRPVYIGKSKQVRTRVLSHFSNDINSTKEMRIAQTTNSIRAIETKTELEALLLESKLIKDLMPIQNRQLRRCNTNYVIEKTINKNGYIELAVIEKNIAELEDISSVYGVYTSRGKAKASLEERRRAFELCPKLLGLEKSKGECFLFQLGRCKGACKSIENKNIYNLRVDLASQRAKLHEWKYGRPMVFSASDGTNVVVDKWVVLGYIDPFDGSFNEVEKTFNLDSYRILLSFIKRNLESIKISPLEERYARI